MPPYIGQQVPHFCQVDVDHIEADFSPCRDYRYGLDLPYMGDDRDENQVVSVVLKNPSSADANSADRTIKRVEEYVYRKFERCKTLRILNLFAYRATNTSDVRDRIRKQGCANVVGSDNDQKLQAAFRHSTSIIAAWGDNHHIPMTCYRARTRRVREFLRPYRDILQQVVDVQNQRPNPLHGLRWQNTFELQRYDPGQ